MADTISPSPEYALVTTLTCPGIHEFKCPICHMPVVQLSEVKVHQIETLDGPPQDYPSIGIPHRGRLGQAQGYCTTRFYFEVMP